MSSHQVEIKQCQKISDKIREQFSKTKEKIGITETVIDYDFLDIDSYKLLTENTKDEFYEYLVKQISNEHMIPLDTAQKWTEEYFRFLVLSKYAQGFNVVPCEAVDKVWHFHMYHTQIY